MWNEPVHSSSYVGKFVVVFSFVDVGSTREFLEFLFRIIVTELHYTSRESTREDDGLGLLRLMFITNAGVHLDLPTIRFEQLPILANK